MEAVTSPNDVEQNTTAATMGAPSDDGDDGSRPRHQRRERKAPKRFTDDGKNPASRWAEDDDAPKRPTAPPSSASKRRRPGGASPSAKTKKVVMGLVDCRKASPRKQQQRVFLERPDAMTAPEDDPNLVGEAAPTTTNPQEEEPASDDEADDDDEVFEELVDVTLATLPFLTRTHVEYVLGEPGTAAFVARRAHASYVLGGAAARRAHRTMFQITFLSVDDAFRRQRVGSKLLARVVDHARDAKCTRLAVYADDTAVGFFERHGFRADFDPLPPSIAATLDVYSDAQLMLLDLTGSAAAAAVDRGASSSVAQRRRRIRAPAQSSSASASSSSCSGSSAAAA
mmetsp:Transcript_23197/g.92023  ORF Transcript_23197/g.92023 Transcript_23197/m.92023 type:complete len:341 (-) Transcript_23197:165-1187(-)